MAKKILVCGATGFIGRNLAEYFAKKPEYEVHAVYCHKPPPPELASNKQVHFHKADLTCKQDVDNVVRGVDFLLQAAATTSGVKDTITAPYLHVTDNAVMNSLIFRSCFEHQVKHVIFFSCTVMYPSSDVPVRESDFNYQIHEKYFGVGWTKVYLERMCHFYSRLGKTKYTAVRHSNIYGPYDKYDLEKSHVFGATIAKVMAAKDEKVVVWGDGSEERDLLHVDDLMRFAELVLTKQEKPFELINAGYGQSVSILNLVKLIIERSRRELRIEFDRSKPTVPFKLALNIERAQKEYGWSPQVSLEEGVDRCLAWYQEYCALYHPVL